MDAVLLDDRRFFATTSSRPASDWFSSRRTLFCWFTFPTSYRSVARLLTAHITTVPILLLLPSAMRSGNAFGRICLSVCQSVSNALTFESFDPTKFIFGMHAHLQNLRVNCINQGRRVKVKVTGAKHFLSVLNYTPNLKFVASAVPEISRASRNLKVGHVT